VQAVGPVQVLSLHRDAWKEVVRLPDSTGALAGEDALTQVALGTLTQLSVLGLGTFGKVVLCKDEVGKRNYALKCMNKRRILQSSMIHHLNQERRVMGDVSRCPFVVRMTQTLQDNTSVYLLMEPIMGGELFNYMYDNPLSEDAARFYAACAVQALDYCHSHGYVYRDLKAENLMIDSTGYLKLTDFGFAKRLTELRTFTMCGTPDYLSPEVIMECGHSYAVDWWALGVLIFEMMTLRRPFTDEHHQMRTIHNIVSGVIAWPPQNLGEEELSPACRDLIERLLVSNPARRLGNLKGGANDIRRHPWFANFDWEALQNCSMPAPMVPHIDSPEDMRHFEEIPLDIPVPGEDEEDGLSMYDENIFVGW